MLRNKSIPLYYQIETIMRKKANLVILRSGFPCRAKSPWQQNLRSVVSLFGKLLASLEQSGLILHQRGKETVPNQG